MVDHLTEMAIYLPSRKHIDSPELAQMIFKWVISKCGVLDNITNDSAKSVPVDFGTAVTSTTLWITASRLPSTHRWTVKPSGSTTVWGTRSKPFATTSRTAGSNCYLWRSLPTSTPSTIPHWWYSSGQTTMTILPCSFSLPRRAVSDYRCQPTGGWQAWKRLTEFSSKILSRLRSNKHSTPVGKRWHFWFKTKYDYSPGTWKHPERQRSSITCAQDSKLWVRSSIRMLTKLTYRVQCWTKVCSLYYFSIVTHRELEVSHL